MLNRFSFLFSFAVLCLMRTVSSVSANVSLGFTTDTYIHTSTIELKPAFLDSDNSYKTASVCFLGAVNCGNDGGFNKGDDYTIDTARQCLNEGFIKNNCNSVQEADGICPYNSSYVKGCKCKSGLISCPDGQVGIGDSCDGKYATCKCDPALVSCSAGQIGSGASCGGKYRSCVCDPSLISCPSNKNGTGASCGGRYQGCVCKQEYQYNSANCTSPRKLSGETCDGKYNKCECPTSAPLGAYGCVYYPAPCDKVCQYTYPDNCRNRNAVSAPANGYCSATYGDCSSKCSAFACNSGYKISGNSCVPTCAPGGASTCSGQTTPCSSTQVQTSSCKDCSGITHYSCRTRTCSDGGYYTYKPFGDNCTTVNYSGLKCYTNDCWCTPNDGYPEGHSCYQIQSYSSCSGNKVYSNPKDSNCKYGETIYWCCSR